MGGALVNKNSIKQLWKLWSRTFIQCVPFRTALFSSAFNSIGCLPDQGPWLHLCLLMFSVPKYLLSALSFSQQGAQRGVDCRVRMRSDRSPPDLPGEARGSPLCLRWEQCPGCAFKDTLTYWHKDQWFLYFHDQHNLIVFLFRNLQMSQLQTKRLHRKLDWD